jgi:pimeloyl-ACP methyl ester carboxylesterase
MPFLHPLYGRIAALAFSLLFSALAVAQDEHAGDWLGTISTPSGDLRLLLTLDFDENGELTAVLESLDQAPGQKIPVSAISIDETQLDFEIATIGASYQGIWSQEAAAYEGVFNQGMALPLNFARTDHIALPVVEGMDGVWEGDLHREAGSLHLTVNVLTDDAGTHVTLDSVDQGAFDIPVVGFERNGDQVGWRVPAANVTYVASLSADGQSISGLWTRPGMPDVDMEFTRTAFAVTPPARPQTPQAPFPYTSEEVSFDNPAASDVRLAGTFTLPEGDGPFPAVVLITGSGPQDRDETVWTHKPFAVIADHLTRHGIAVLRYDDRGFGESTGSFSDAVSSDFADDAAAAASWLAQRPEIDPRRIGLVGHSEGGLIAPMIAADNDAIAFLVLLAAPGTDGQSLLLEQSQLITRVGGASEDDLATLYEIQTELFTAVAAAEDRAAARDALDELLTPELIEIIGVLPDQRDMVIRQMTSDWYRQLLRHDPAPWLARTRQPVLALQGSLDLQVAPTSNLDGLRQGLTANPDVTLTLLENRNHMFQTAETGSIAEYGQIEETFSPEALVMMSEWINARFGVE